MLFGGFSTQDLILMLYRIPALLLTLSVHELAHGYTAYRLGDPTARNLGRLTLNPIKHIDPIGLLMMIVVGFGWAKPVLVNPRNFKRGKRDTAIVAAAGPLSNVALAFVGVLMLRLFILFVVVTDGALLGNSFNVYVSIATFLQVFINLNLALAVFNLLPIPPLDGSRILDLFLSPRASYQYARVQQYGFIILMVGLFTGILTTPIMFGMNALLRIINTFWNLIPFLNI
jgi:Zn-dependent protease